MPKHAIGYICLENWTNNPKSGYIELHPTETTTVQVVIDQLERTIHINGFFKSITHNSSNSITLNF